MRTKFQVSSMILTGFTTQTPSPPQNEPLKRTPRLELRDELKEKKDIIEKCVSQVTLESLLTLLTNNRKLKCAAT